MSALFALWILSSDPAFAVEDVVSTRSRQLALAVGALHGGDAAGSMAILVNLHEGDPSDDDVAYWLAYLHYSGGRNSQALALLSGREGLYLPSCRFRILEGRTVAVQGDRKRALELLKPCQEEAGPDQSLLAGLMGMLWLDQGEKAQGIEWILRSGGNPWEALDRPLRDAFPEARDTRVLQVLQPSEGFIEVVADAAHWRVDLSSGWSVRIPEAPPVTLDGGFDVDGAQRSEVVPCDDGYVWSSPSEPLAGGRSGVFRTQGGDVVRVSASPALGVDERPSCAGDEVWFVRRAEGLSALIAAKNGPDWAWSPPVGALASVDARLGADGGTELLLGWVIEGEVGVWTTRAEPFKPVKVLQGEALAPRWSR
ncbi:MAG: tetratricopeptide repeat protein [Myxococcota bacterium]|nr:tetratricopeptide repeat protein [Myxococcota bacterium]